MKNHFCISDDNVSLTKIKVNLSLKLKCKKEYFGELLLNSCVNVQIFSVNCPAFIN